VCAAQFSLGQKCDFREKRKLFREKCFPASRQSREGKTDQILFAAAAANSARQFWARCKVFVASGGKMR
jgi:hypothetical protein